MDHSKVRKLLSDFGSLLQLKIRPLDSRIEPNTNRGAFCKTLQD